MKTTRTCFALDLKDDDALIAEYEHYHRPEHIWPEIPTGIIAAGITDMQIYRIGLRLFMIVETVEGTDLENAFEAMGKMPRQCEWAAFMSRFQQRLELADVGEHWAKMNPIFLLKDCLNER